MKDIVVFPFLLLLLFVSAGGAAGIALRQERGFGSSEGNRIQHIDASSSSSSFLFSSFEKKRPQKQAIEWDDEEIEGHDDVLEKDYFKGDGGEERLQKIDSVDTQQQSHASLNLRPIIGVLAQEMSYYLIDHLPPNNYTSHIVASYVKFVESAGARVVPILINQTDEYYERMFNYTNGILWPGGAVSIQDSGYALAGKKFFEMSKSAFDSSGDVYPIWGTCLGFEMLAYLGNDDQPNLFACEAYNATNQLIPSEQTADQDQSEILSSMPQDVRTILTGERATSNFHHWCLTPTNFTEMNMDRFFFEPAFLSKDVEDTEYIALLEARNYPMYGTQFHPEKVAYEWTLKYPTIPHFTNAIRANNWFAEFFVDQTRKSQHRFPSRAEEEAALIYNYSPTFTGEASVDYTMVQDYLFE